MRSAASLRSVIALAFCAWVAGPAPAQDEESFDERNANVFYKTPDDRTRDRIATLISRVSSGSVADRIATRRELEEIGYWSVGPLNEALAEREPPVRSASALTLSAIRDPRSVEPMRQAVLRESSHPHVAAFAALGLGRYRDGASVPALRTSLRSSKGLRAFRAAAPLALARIGTPEAQTLLMERIRAGEGNDAVRGARLLALGFFPSVAMRADRPEPSSELQSGLSAGRRSLRHAAVLAFVVASLRRNDTRDFLFRFIAREKKPEVLVAALVGVSRYEDDETTRLLARTAARSGEDIVRIVAADLLVSRGDPAALPDLLALLRKPAPARLKASAIVALGGIDDPDVADAVLDRLNDRSDLVRAAAAVATVQFGAPGGRDDALRRIDARLKHGEQHRAVRANLRIARSVLAGDEDAPQWREVGRAPVFAALFSDHEERILALVNRAAEDTLDLRKIHNLQTDTEVLAGSTGAQDGGGGGGGDDGGDDGDSGGGGDDGGDDGGEGDDGDGEGGDVSDPGPGTGEVSETDSDRGGSGESPDTNVDRGGPPTAGSTRTQAWQELRDLKVELRREPYFGFQDLP